MAVERQDSSQGASDSRLEVDKEAEALGASAKALSASAKALSASAKALSAGAKALSAGAKALSASANDRQSASHAEAVELKASQGGSSEKASGDLETLSRAAELNSLEESSSGIKPGEKGQADGSIWSKVKSVLKRVVVFFGKGVSAMFAPGVVIGTLQWLKWINLAEEH